MSGSYAPELNIVGAVLGSPVGDLGHTFRRLNGTLHVRPARARGRRTDAHLSRAQQGHPGARHRRGQAMLQRLQNDDHRPSGHPDGQHGHGQDGRSATRADPRHPRSPACLRRHQARHGGAHPAGADRPGGPRPDDLRGRHRRTGRHLPVGRRLCDLPPRHVQRAHAAAPDVGADDVALADRPVRRQAARASTWCGRNGRRC